ncbi:hypothetical protein [Streptomyces sp. STR69]|uniref:hypothetical protein n=1 Tax=Streptomyces sp. STR69 TaxID=1796942 RepID=UPI0021C56C04|nr:hypothetical protein [Streptomyces sp. STR69]
MSGWDDFGARRGPSEESGQAVWSAWSTAETQTSLTPPPWVSPPAPAPAPAPVPVSGRSAWRFVLVVTATVVLGAGAGAGFWYVTQDRTTTHDQVAVARSAYRTTQDPTGYTVEIPRDWTRVQRQGAKAPVISYDSPDGTRRLQIFRVTEPSPAESLDLAEHAPGYGFARQPGYQVLGRTSGPTWAELTYRYDDLDHGARRVIDHRFAAADGSLYAIHVSGPESVSSALVRDPLTEAVASFCPAGAKC